MSLKASNLSDIKTLRHGFFDKRCALGSAPKTNLASLAAIADELMAMPSDIVTLNQMHSAEVVVINSPASFISKSADAMVSTTRGLLLGIYTADCVPVLFADEQSNIVAAAHAGSRGAFLGIIENTVSAMRKLGANSVVAALGPCIWPKSYEVDLPFYEQFGPSPFFHKGQRADHWQFDLPGLVISRLKECGVKSIFPSPADTYANAEIFHSYRRAIHQKSEVLLRNFSAIGLT